jgi:hypothetical protein
MDARRSEAGLEIERTIQREDPRAKPLRVQAPGHIGQEHLCPAGPQRFDDVGDTQDAVVGAFGFVNTNTPWYVDPSSTPPGMRPFSGKPLSPDASTCTRNSSQPSRDVSSGAEAIE